MIDECPNERSRAKFSLKSIIQVDVLQLEWTITLLCRSGLRLLEKLDSNDQVINVSNSGYFGLRW
jgi:hypothetical protein